MDPQASGGAAPAALRAAWAEHRLPLMAALVAQLGDLDRAEEALSEAALRAQRSWAAAIPANPSGWLYRVALNVARDSLRAEARRGAAEPILRQHLTPSQNDGPGDVLDDALEVTPAARLDLFSLCADPVLSQEQQIALMLFHLAGLDCSAIAKAFLVPETTIYQRLSRARAKLKERSPAIAGKPDLSAVRSSLELIYLQSYRNLDGGVETDALGRDALQLTAALCRAADTDGENWALLALLLCLDARRPARLDQDGQFIPFSVQDPSHWSSSGLIRAAAAMKRTAILADGPEPYGLRAQIELTRMIARREGEPCDVVLLSLYDALIALTNAPYAAMDRALVLARLQGPRSGLAALDAIETQGDLSGHAGWHLAKADLHVQIGDIAQARLHMKAALTLIDGPAERAFVSSRFNALSA
ncbi:DUF6596 domain-containing protein [Algimonas porphyrae]|uniref:RNA polymerase sigma factor n=2 Tax=Algimonas porphyrae TaxID=1128113 RepID=A0ABQ5UXB4_9PROT|nr:DUF6596 domain-containing protein [Algimonas porphyrae]GLQ19798.1 RNA polymerase sigma factor [Algimonas porphyrae]